MTPLRLCGPTLAFWVFLAPLALAHASQTQTLGLQSNLLVSASKLYFVQWPGRITVIDVATGEVLRQVRTEAAKASDDRLVDTPHGILLIGRFGMALLDRETLELQWKAPFGGYASLAGDGELVVSLSEYDEKDAKIACHRIADGELVWAIEPAGYPTIVAAGDHVAIAANVSPPDEIAARIVRLDSGKVVATIKQPEKGQVSQVFFDGHKVYTAINPVTNGSSPPRFSRIDVYDLAGKALPGLPVPPEFKGKEYIYQPADREPFSTSGLTFHADGTVLPEDPPRPADGPGAGAPFGGSDVREYAITGGTVRFGWVRDREEQVEWILDHASTGGAKSWRGIVTIGGIDELVATAADLLLGSGNGEVECIDRATGASRWLYLFPTKTRMFSWNTGYGAPPTQEELDENAREQRAAAPPPRGLVPLPAGFDAVRGSFAELRDQAPDYTGKLVFDPQAPPEFRASFPVARPRAEKVAPEPAAAPPPTGAPVWVWPAALAALAVILAVMVLRRRRPRG